MSDEVTTDEDQKEIEEAKTAAVEKHQEVMDHAKENLAALRDDPTPDESEDESTSDKSKEDQTDETEDTEESTSEKTDDSESEDESTSDKSKEDQTDDTSDSEADENALTQAEVRAAIHSGWSQEDIDELAEANPGLAKKTCAKALESQNNLSQKFSELGKTQAAAPVAPAVPVTPAADPKPKTIDFTAMRKQYEDDPIVDVLEQVVNQSQAQAAEISTLREAAPKADAAVNKAEAQQDAAVSQQVDTFFERPDVVAYKDTYGEVEKGSRDWDGLTQGQIKKRYEVAEEANRIMLGAQKMQQEMPVDEAFERAHFLVTKDVQEAAIRKTIKAKAVKRTKSLTFEPTGSKKVPDSGKKTVAKAQANAEGRLRKLFRR